MIKERKEFFVLVKESGEYSISDVEWFETFEEARSHINDLDEKGQFKYTAWFLRSQACYIERRAVGGKLPRMVTLNRWSFKKGQLDTDYSFNYAEQYREENYKGKVW